MRRICKETKVPEVCTHSRRRFWATTSAQIIPASRGLCIRLGSRRPSCTRAAPGTPRAFAAISRTTRSSSLTTRSSSFYIFRPAALTVDMNSNPSAVKNDLDRAEALAMQGDPLVVRYFSMRYLLTQKKITDGCAANIAVTIRGPDVIRGAKSVRRDHVERARSCTRPHLNDDTSLSVARQEGGAPVIRTGDDHLKHVARA